MIFYKYLNKKIGLYCYKDIYKNYSQTSGSSSGIKSYDCFHKIAFEFELFLNSNCFYWLFYNSNRGNLIGFILVLFLFELKIWIFFYLIFYYFNNCSNSLIDLSFQLNFGAKLLLEELVVNLV